MLGANFQNTADSGIWLQWMHKIHIFQIFDRLFVVMFRFRFFICTRLPHKIMVIITIYMYATFECKKIAISHEFTGCSRFFCFFLHIYSMIFFGTRMPFQYKSVFEHNTNKWTMTQKKDTRKSVIATGINKWHTIFTHGCFFPLFFFASQRILLETFFFFWKMAMRMRCPLADNNNKFINFMKLGWTNGRWMCLCVCPCGC